MVLEMLVADQPEQAEAHDKSAHLWDMAELNGVVGKPVPEKAGRRAHPAFGRQPRGDVGQPGCLHSVWPVRAGLP